MGAILVKLTERTPLPVLMDLHSILLKRNVIPIVPHDKNVYNIETITLNFKGRNMRLNNTITITPPPFTNNLGQVTYPSPLILDALDLVFTDNVKSKTVYASIIGIPSPIVLWSENDYDNAGDWTQLQAESKLMELLGDNPAVALRALFPKTLEENPNHPGTVLAKMIKSLGFTISDNCQCKKHALEMNEKGNDWCVENIDTIVTWLKEETRRRNIVFIDMVARLMVMRAIKKSRKLLANQPVPENDEELDNMA
jgi:hypothetical protein